MTASAGPEPIGGALRTSSQEDLIGGAPMTPEAAELGRVLDESDPKHLVEVGAHDGMSMSTSNALIRQGWAAVLMEPHPAIFSRLAAIHAGNANVTCLQRACSANAGSLPLYIGTGGDNTMLSTLSTDSNPWFDVARSATTVDVRVDRLAEVLVETGVPQEFGLLLVDTEGMDDDVLRGMDFDRFRPRAIITEEYLWNVEKHRRKYQLLLEHGYAFYTKLEENTIWLETRHWERFLSNLVASNSPA